MLYLQCCPTDTRQREEVKSIWRILLISFLVCHKNKKKPPVFALLRASFFLSTWTCYFFSPTGIIAYADQEINMQVILKHSETNKKLLFTHHCPARCFGMNMPKIPRHTSQKFHCRRQSGMNFGYVTVNGVNSNNILSVQQCVNIKEKINYGKRM